MTPVRRIAPLVLGLWFPASALAAQEPPPALPAYEKLRFDEDYRTFRSLSESGDWFERLKHIPLGASGESRFLSFGGELRERYERTANPGFGADPEDDRGVWLQRAVLHGDLHVGPHLRLFGQLFSAIEEGRKGGPSPVDENELTLQNGFVDIAFPVAPDGRVTLRPGRQELHFGSGRLIDVRNGPNVRRTFDAVRADLDTGLGSLTALAGWPRATEAGSFDDRTDESMTLYGLYGASSAGLLPRGSLDLYVLGFEDDQPTFVQPVGEEDRVSVGARFHGGAGGWDWNWEAVYQGGTAGAADIHAWTLASDTGYRWHDALWSPRLGLNANVASGDDDPEDGLLGTFNPLFPRGNYFSEAAVLGPRNFFNVHPSLSVAPLEELALTADWNFFWRLETEDGVYTPSGALLRGPGGSGERFVGSALSLAAEWQINRHLSFAAIYSHFFPGGFIDDTGPSRDIDFIEITLLARF